VTGDIFGRHQVTDEIANIRVLLSPLDWKDVRTVRCLGLNYERHAKEVSFSISKQKGRGREEVNNG